MSTASKNLASSSAEGIRNYNGVDLLRFLCAIMVFAIHIPPLDGVSFEYAKYISYGVDQFILRLAVPCFFISNGFFLFRKMQLPEIKVDVIKNYCFRILQMLGIWSVLLVVGRTFHLWYLGATVVAIILLSLLLHARVKFRYLYLIAGVLYFIGLLGDSHHWIIEPVEHITVVKYIIKGYEYFFDTTRNGVFMGFIFVLIGATFAHFNIKMKLPVALLGFVGSMACLCVEVWMVWKFCDMYLFLVPASFFLFYIACNIRLKDHMIYKMLRNVGTLVYYLHLLVNDVARLGIVVLRKYAGVDCEPFKFLISLLMTLMLAVLIERLSHKEKFKWLQWLY